MFKKKSLPEVFAMEGLQNLSRLHKFNTSRYPFLLESCPDKNENNSENETSRYGILFAFPGQSLILNSAYCLEGIKIRQRHFLKSLDAWWDREKNTDRPHNLPFSGGWFLFLAYELASEIEPILNLPEPDQNFPVAAAVRIPSAVINDYRHNRSYIIAERDHSENIHQMKIDLSSLNKHANENSNHTEKQNSRTEAPEEEDEKNYIHSVRSAVEYIHAGDVFQVNLSRKWSAPISENISSQEIFQKLSETNPSPFSGIAVFSEGDIISSSPERLIQVRERKIETRPIAGTRPRYRKQDDNNEQSYLKTNPKELAEHRMMIDLERNDLGKICEFGSIAINENMMLEKFAHVHHIVSVITGILKKDITPGEIIRAVFPGGTITGCPKVRCMEIISELEQEPRGAYTGSMGYLNLNGDMDLNILIRTMVRIKDKIYFRAGAGIVADSDPEKELEETRAKAKGLVLSLKNL
ncbi:MAG: aminodeoxychorismate synthase component I [Spirochaetia bacterium]|nr:aminodeoxychorismate synthase component I [Spirochaetia bacterium]